MAITYKIGKRLYLNITNRCTNNCIFCVRNKSKFIQGYDLSLDREPTAAEIIRAIDDPEIYQEIVFCGYGEPLLRLKEVLEVSRYLKNRGCWVRINTNGHGNLIHQRNIVPELAPVIAAISVSLNVDSEEKYLEICQPSFGPGTYQEVKEFILECKKYIPKIIVTVINLPQVDLKTCEIIVRQELGVDYKIRRYNDILEGPKR